MKIENVTIQGHRGTWYSISSRTYSINNEEVEVHLFEHERYGDEAAHVFATVDGKLLMENVWNGWADWREYFIDEQAPGNLNTTLTWSDAISI